MNCGIEGNLVDNIVYVHPNSQIVTLLENMTQTENPQIRTNEMNSSRTHAPNQQNCRVCKVVSKEVSDVTILCMCA